MGSTTISSIASRPNTGQLVTHKSIVQNETHHSPDGDVCSHDVIELADKDQSLEFWKSRLHELQPCILTLPKHDMLPSISSPVKLEVNLYSNGARSHDFCKNVGVSLATVFKAAWGMVLRTYISSDYVCFGCKTMEQDTFSDDVDAIIKSQVATLPCEVQFREDTTPFDIIRKLEFEFIETLPHQHIPLAEVYRELGMGRDALFNTSMIFFPGERSFNNLPPEALSTGTADMKDLTDYDIIVHVDSKGQCSLSYWNHFMSDEQANHLAGALSVAFNSIVESPHSAVGQVEVFSNLDRQKLLQWNQRAPVASESCLHDLISQKCHSQPDSLAVVSWDGSFTYRELDRLSSTLAGQLHAAGVGPDVFVPIYSDRCKWVPVAMLGIMKAGGAFCALDSSYPPSRLLEICRALKSTMMLTTANKTQQAGQLVSTIIILGDNLRTYNNADGGEPQTAFSDICPKNALYAVFTSGSTGKPKGIVIEHQSFSSCVLASLMPLNIRPQERVLHFASYAFDLSIFEILTPLASGASVAIPSEEARLKDLPGTVRELQATWAFLTPTVARLYQSDDFPSLQTLCLGGEAVDARDIGMWTTKNLVTGYNPAECCPLGISGQLDQPMANFLGWSFSSQCAWIVDPQNCQKLVPIGAIGELVIEGPAIARGYIHDPTSSIPDSPFIPSPPWLSRFRASSSRATRLYRTGDLVQYGRDGAVHFVGRKDLQVKIRGQRIELTEIEFHLHKALSHVTSQVVVEAVEFTDRTALVAFISSTERSGSKRVGESPLLLEETTQQFEHQVADAASKLRRTLPSYMVPASYLPIRYIPMSRSGKIDRSALKSLAISLPPEILVRIGGQSGPGKAPATDMHRRLQSLFAQVIGCTPDRIQTDSNFFQLGGDSIQAMKLLALAHQDGLGDLTFQDIFQRPVLEDMALALSSIIERPSSGSEDLGLAPFTLVKDASSLVNIVSEQCGVAEGDIEDIYPCTPLQASLITATSHDKDAYVALQSFILQDDVDKIRLERAWNTVAENHGILRTRIVLANDSFYQAVVRGPVTFSEGVKTEGLANPLDLSIGLGTPLIQLHLTGQRLLVAMHHAIYDGWSLALLFAEVDQAYRQLSIRQGPMFNRFAKHVLDSMDSAVSYWKAELHDADPVHFPGLPFLDYKPEPCASTTRSISLTDVNDVRRIVTVATELQLAWAVTSNTYEKSQDVIFGVISSGRTASVEGIDRMLGPTLASTPLRVFINPGQKVTEALEEVQYRSVEKMRYEHAGLQNIARQGPNEAAACRFQTLLVIEPRRPDKTPGRWYRKHEFLSKLTKFSSHSLTLRCQLLPDSVKVTAIFDPIVVPGPQMQHILSQFEHILTQVRAVGLKDTRIGDINRLNSQDWDTLTKWNCTLPPAPELCVHQMIQDKCQRQPEALAIHSWDGDLTYHELEQYSKRLASHLQSLGVGPNSIIAIFLKKSLWTVVAQVAVLTAGAAFITLETSQPIDRLRETCHTIQPAAVLTSDELHISKVDLGIGCPYLVLNQQFLHREADGPERPPKIAVTKASDAMYSIATSGTTGKPKVVVIEHRAFLATAMRLIDLWGLTADSRVLQFAGYSFDIMILEHFLTLLAGGSICIPSSFDRENRLATIMEEMRINFALLTTSTIPLLTPAAVSSLRILVQAGEPMHHGIIDCWASHVRLFNAYGPTECAVCCCSTGVISSDARNPKNIGFAVGCVHWVVDPDLPDSPPVPIGAEGELIIEGAVLARGYLGDPARTAGVFTPRPPWLHNFRGGSGEDRVYRTGDIVKYQLDGSISYVRRNDSQVKLRGQRIELQEVEHHLQSCFPNAAQIVADVVTLSDTQSTILVALVLIASASSSEWVAANPNHGGGAPDNNILLPANSSRFLTTASTAELALRERVPSYMVPSLFIPISKVPRGVNGKVNRKEISRSLASLSREEWNSYASLDRVAPSTDLERKLQSIWARILNITPESIGIFDSLFRLGGDSITCMQVAAQCRGEGILITVKDIFEQRTIGKLAAIAAEMHRSEPLELINITETDSSWCRPDQLEEYMERIRPYLKKHQVVQDVYPCSPIQQGILMSCARNPSHYEEVIQWKVSSKDPIDVDRLRDAWHQVVERHSMLRTVFLDVFGENYLDQVVLKSHIPSVIVYSDGEDPGKPDLSDNAQPMHHLQVKISSAGTNTVSLYINHALVDGHSLFIIRRDLALAYEGRLVSSPAPSPYHEYIAYLQKGHSRQKSREYWKSYIEGTSPCLFPSLNDLGSEDQPQPFGAFTLTLGKTTNITQFCEDHKLALTSVLHVAWAIVVRRYTEMDEICFGYMSSGRHVPIAGANDIVGPLFNMLVARMNLSSDATALSIMQQYQDGFLSSLDHQHQPLAETLHSIGSASGELFNTLISIFNDTKECDPSQQPSAISLVGDDIQNQSEYPIALNILMLAEQAHMMFSYHKSLLSDGYARIVAKAFCHVLGTVLKRPQLPLNEIEVLDEEHRCNLYERNRSIVAPLDNCLHYVIHQHSLDFPDSPAVCAWDGDFTYRQLDQLSSSLANELISQGIGPEVVIPVLLEKTCWTPVAMIAVLKSGASFVLMDASHPLKRLQTIYKVVNAPLILASPQTSSKALEISPLVIEVTGRLFEQEQSEKKHSWLRVTVEGSNAAYILFTSGTTGQPKGAIIEHSCLATSLEHMSSRFFTNSRSRVLQFTSHAWDIAVLEVLLTLRVGGCVCIPSDEERISNIAQAANRMMVNWAIVTPTVSRLVRPEDFVHLETLVLGGEPMSPTDLATWHDKVRLLEGYGPAECSMISTISKPLVRSSHPRNIGQPSGCVAWVVHRDNHHLLVPPGAIGELVLEGPIVGRGYINDPELSAAVFIDPPSWLVSLRNNHIPRKLYKTGDLVRPTLDGTFIFVGRKDNQVKIRGQRVELGEVEASVSRAFPKSYVVVELVKDSGLELLVAFILEKEAAYVPRNSNSSLLHPASNLFRESVSAAISGLRESMPSYMIPNLFLPLAYLPKSPTGKTERKVLRDHVASLSQVELEVYRTMNSSRREPSTSLEARLQECVGDVLHKSSDSIPLDEDLFAVGLDSLKAMALATSARGSGLEISVPTIFEYPRLSELAIILGQKQGAKQEQRPIAQPNLLMASIDELCQQWRLDRSQVVNVVPTTYYQRTFIASHHAAFIALHFSRPLDYTTFRTAFVAAVQKHHILRTAFVPFQGSFVQISLNNFDVPVQEIITDEEDPSIVTESICREVDKLPVLFGTPTTQLLLIVGRVSGRLSAVLRLLRAQYDGVTVSSIIADLRSAFDHPAISPTSLPTLAYPDFIASRIAYNTPPVYQVWRELLEGSSMTYLAPRREYTRDVDISQIELEAKVTRDIAMPDTNWGFTMATVVKAAWALCLARKAQTQDVVFAQIVRNRHLAISGVERTVGPCLNLAPVRVPIRPEWDGKDLLQFVQYQQMRTMACDTVDWDDLVTETTAWQRGTDPGSAIHYLSAPLGSDYIFAGDVPCHMQLLDFKMTQIYPLMLCLPFPSEQDSTVTILRIVFTSAIFGQDVAEEIISDFIEMVIQLTNHPELLISKLLEPVGGG
ncbi:lysergyl peptide synthetase subunit 1 [Annulohypoxylon truncatum]|uniref:lysergyl peptide synthetase subunit 1 n=1 Tax=Annulohypoxylon truncatum TaxID=327061 RepID=UPI0020075CBA|nr:lysergyl peptide synthetase subunit 1 [Annulohypoxylon truncatum]KAI1214321.1 lysergyl peptide synthetase subunit 1 [Annulohypoxylon truncatum]